MIKLKLQIGILLFMLFFVFPQTKGYAFLPKIDGLKSGSKLSNFFLNLKSNTEKAMEWVVNSKASQLIGDGIKETKNGISFAKESYANAMNFYGQTVETVDKVKSSDEYKTAVISKQIINESSELKKLEEEKLTKLEDLQQEMELLQSQNTSKINNINNNIDVLETSTVDEVSINNINQQIASLQQQTQEQLQELEQQYNQIEAEYDSKIEEKKNNISELNKKLADIANSKLVSENAGESIKDTQKSMFTLQGEETDIKNRREKRDNRKKALSDTIDETVD